MAQPTREEALAVLEDLRSHLDELMDRLGDDERDRPGTIGGGDWSAKDLLGHLSLWEELAVEGAEYWRDGRRPRAEEVFEGSIDDANAEDVERKRGWSWDRVRTHAAETHDRLLGLIRSMSEEEWRAKAPYHTERRNRMVSFLGSVLGAPAGPFRHTEAHLPDLEAYVSSLGR